MLKNLMVVAALFVGVGLSTSAIEAQEKPVAGKEAKKASESGDEVELPKDDPKARAAVEKAFKKIYSAKGKGMKKLYGKITRKAEVAYDMMGQKGTAKDQLDMLFAWNGKEAVATKDVTEKEPDMMGRMLRRNLKEDAGRIAALLDIMIGAESFEKRYPAEKSSFAFVTQTDEDKKAKIQRIEVTVLEGGEEEAKKEAGKKEAKKEEGAGEEEAEPATLRQEAYALTDGVLSELPNEDGKTIVTFQKKGRDLFFKTVKMDTKSMGQTVPKEYVFSDIKKAGKYKLPTTIKVASDFGRFGKGTTEIKLSGFKVDKKVTKKLLASVIEKKKAKDDDAGVEEVKKDESKDDKKKKDDGKKESPIKGIDKNTYDRIKNMMKGRNGGKEPSDKEIKEAYDRFKNFRGGGNGGGRGGNRGGGRRGR